MDIKQLFVVDEMLKNQGVNYFIVSLCWHLISILQESGPRDVFTLSLFRYNMLDG